MIMTMFHDYPQPSPPGQIRQRLLLLLALANDYRCGLNATYQSPTATLHCIFIFFPTSINGHRVTCGPIQEKVICRSARASLNGIYGMSTSPVAIFPADVHVSYRYSLLSPDVYLRTTPQLIFFFFFFFPSTLHYYFRRSVPRPNQLIMMYLEFPRKLA